MDIITQFHRGHLSSCGTRYYLVISSTRAAVRLLCPLLPVLITLGGDLPISYLLCHWDVLKSHQQFLPIKSILARLEVYRAAFKVSAYRKAFLRFSGLHSLSLKGTSESIVTSYASSRMMIIVVLKWIMSWILRLQCTHAHIRHMREETVHAANSW